MLDFASGPLIDGLLLLVNQTGSKMKVWQCRLCGKMNPRKYDLQKHVRIHTGERPFACKVCQRTFNDKSAIIKHLRNMHKIDNIAEYVQTK